MAGQQTRSKRPRKGIAQGAGFRSVASGDDIQRIGQTRFQIGGGGAGEFEMRAVNE